MQIIDFTRAHVPAASALALCCYQAERTHVPELPPMDRIPDITAFADSRLGVAALENGRMVGFLCFSTPWDNVFCTNARGTFSPMHAHGARTENRASIYQHMYQAAAENVKSFLWIRPLMWKKLRKHGKDIPCPM